MLLRPRLCASTVLQYSPALTLLTLRHVFFLLSCVPPAVPSRRRAPKGPPGSTSPLQSIAPDAAAAADDKSSSKEADGWAQLEQWRGMTLESECVRVCDVIACGVMYCSNGVA
jgi:hypothetical protein